MRWHGLTVRMNGAGVAANAWRLLWAASVAGEAADEGNAVFATRPAGGYVTLYFPPCAHLLAFSVGATSCAKPQAHGLTVLAGEQGAWQVHFAPAEAEAPVAARAA